MTDTAFEDRRSSDMTINGKRDGTTVYAQRDRALEVCSSATAGFLKSSRSEKSPRIPSAAEVGVGEISRCPFAFSICFSVIEMPRFS